MPPALDPNTNTRAEFTTAAVGQPIPDDADPRWKELNQTLKALALKLLDHDAMRRNKTQPFMAPAADKNRVYFLWDSATRALANLYRLPWQLQASSHWNADFEKLWKEECVAKSSFLASLILGPPTGAAADPMTMMMNMMMAQSGDAPELGDDVKQLAGKLLRV